MLLEDKPVKLWYSVEIWEYEEGRIGWRVNSENGRPIDWWEAGSLFMEMAEDFYAGKDTKMRMSLFFREDDTFTVRKHSGENFSEFLKYLELRGKFHKAFKNMVMVRDATTPKIFYFFWSLVWLWQYIQGHFKHSQTSPTAAATPVAAGSVTTASEQSEGSENSSHGAGATVLPFRKQRRSDDSRPL